MLVVNGRFLLICFNRLWVFFSCGLYSTHVVNGEEKSDKPVHDDDHDHDDDDDDDDCVS